MKEGYDTLYILVKEMNNSVILEENISSLLSFFPRETSNPQSPTLSSP